MANEWSLCVPRLPDCLQERTKKDKLFNDLICQELEQLQQLTDISYTCGAKTEDIQLPLGLNCVEKYIHMTAMIALRSSITPPIQEMYYVL